MSWAALLAVTLVTVLSRTAPMALLPAPRGRVAEVLAALPAPLFASLAALSLLDGGAPPELPVLTAAGGALLGAVRRSLALTLLGGVVGFLLGQLFGQAAGVL